MLVVRLRVAWNGGVRLTGCGSVDDALSVSMVNGAVELFLRGEDPLPGGGPSELLGLGTGCWGRFCRREGGRGTNNTGVSSPQSPAQAESTGNRRSATRVWDQGTPPVSPLR